MNKKVNNDSLLSVLKGLADWSEAQSKAAAVLNLLVKRGLITETDRATQLDDATKAVLNERRWALIQTRGRAHASNDASQTRSLAIQEKLFAWLDKNYTKYAAKFKDLDLVAEEVCRLNVVPWGKHQIRRQITEYRKRKKISR